MKYNSVEEWKAEATRRFGPDMLKWRFRCSMCGHVASVQDFKNAGAKSPSCTTLAAGNARMAEKAAA